MLVGTEVLMCHQKYPNFANRVHTALVDIFGEKGKRIVTHHAEDGSGVGSAIIAGKSAGVRHADYSRSGWQRCYHVLILVLSYDEGEEGQGLLHGLLIVATRF